MSRIDDDVIIELQVIVVERVEQLLGQLFRLIVAHQVGASGGVDEQRVAGKDAPRLRGAFLLGRFIRHMLGRVAGRVPRGEHQVAEFKLVADP